MKIIVFLFVVIVLPSAIDIFNTLPKTDFGRTIQQTFQLELSNGSAVDSLYKKNKLIKLIQEIDKLSVKQDKLLQVLSIEQMPRELMMKENLYFNQYHCQMKNEEMNYQQKMQEKLNLLDKDILLLTNQTLVALIAELKAQVLYLQQDIVEETNDVNNKFHPQKQRNLMIGLKVVRMKRRIEDLFLIAESNKWKQIKYS